jgi:O-6-methylguanine DNA methyltransferase
MEKVCYAEMETPKGILWAAATEGGLLCTGRSEENLFEEIKRKLKAEFVKDPSKFQELREWLDAFYRGDPVSYEGTFDLRGTEFQKKVWRAIHDIPYGRLTSYGRIAKDIGKPRAARAVGNAVGANPLGPIIPCHRVVWSNGGLGGFGGGLGMKRELLHLEGVLPRVEGTPERDVDLRQFFYR